MFCGDQGCWRVVCVSHWLKLKVCDLRFQVMSCYGDIKGRLFPYAAGAGLKIKVALLQNVYFHWCDVMLAPILFVNE